MVDAVLGLIGTLLYPLFSIIFVVLSLMQNVFYSFAGIGNVYYGSSANGTGSMTPITGENDGGEASSGLLYYLLTSSVVKNIIISILILGLFLLVIFTTLAFIKTIYVDKPKSWRDIITSAVKGLTNFIVLPVCCLLGVWVGNIVLQAINGATSSGGSIYLDRKLFVACSYDANYYRLNSFDANSSESAEAYAKIMATLSRYSSNKEMSELKPEQGKNSEYYARVVDEMFSTSAININRYSTVGEYYQLYSINYLFLIVGGIFMLYVMANVTYGMIKRMFILMMLFVISPALCAMYPLDDGAAVKSWSGDVKKNILSAYGAVAGMNLFFSLMPVIQNINISLSGNASLADWTGVSNILQLIILICGLFCVNDFINMISGYIGAGNAFGDGKSLRASTKGAIQKQTKKVGNVAGAFARANAAGSVGGAKAWFGSMAKSTTGGVQKSLGLDWGLKDEYKKGLDDYYKSQDAHSKALKADKDRQKDKTQQASDRAMFKGDKATLKRDLEAHAGDKAEQRRLKREFNETHGYHYTNEADAVDQILRFKSDDLRKREAYRIAAASNGEISGEKLYGKAKAEDSARKVKSASGVADAVVAGQKEEQSAQRTFNFAKMQVQKLEALETDLTADGLHLEGALGHSMFDKKVTDAEMTSLSAADQAIAQRYNANFDERNKMPSKQILEENITEAGKALASAATNMEVQIDKLAAKMGVTLEDAINTVGRDLGKLDSALRDTSLTDAMKNFVNELDKSRKKMKDGDK